MTNIWKSTAAVAVLAAATAFSAPACADGFSIGFGEGGVAFTYDSGGYCDRWGCPDEYWDYPIYDCPVFYHGEWYRGPVYYRRSFGVTYYWIRGGWHRDERCAGVPPAARERSPDDPTHPEPSGALA
jgi:hypothetical protein